MIRKRVLKVLRNHSEAIGWMIDDLRGIDPQICTHRIHLEDGAMPSREMQRKLNPHTSENVRNDIIKLLDAGIIYLISDSEWVNPVQIVPKMSGIIVVENDRGERILTRTPTGWRVCIDYRKLNSKTRKDHFPLPFLDKS